MVKTGEGLSVSVVVPVYNGESTIGKCIESLLLQDFPAQRFEVVIVENGSTDGTTGIVSRYPVRLLHNTVRGPSAARQFGLGQSVADVIAFTDADCYADPHWLSELTKPYTDLRVGGVGGPILGYKHPERNVVEQFADDKLPLINFTTPRDGEYMPRLHTCNASYRRALVQKIGGFDTRLITADDTDLSWRLQLQTGAALAYAPKAVVYHHHRTTQHGLAKQYRQYGFAEILLDTMYGQLPGYPRTRLWQVRRMLGQVWALPRYALLVAIWRLRSLAGRATAYQTENPRLCMLAETSNLRGKWDGLKATHFMTNASGVLSIDAGQLINRYFQSEKE